MAIAYSIICATFMAATNQDEFPQLSTNIFTCIIVVHKWVSTSRSMSWDCFQYPCPTRHSLLWKRAPSIKYLHWHSFSCNIVPCLIPCTLSCTISIQSIVKEQYYTQPLVFVTTLEGKELSHCIGHIYYFNSCDVQKLAHKKYWTWIHLVGSWLQSLEWWYPNATKQSPTINDYTTSYHEFILNANFM